MYAPLTGKNKMVHHKYELELTPYEFNKVSDLLFTDGKRNDFISRIDTGWGQLIHIFFIREEDCKAIASLVCSI